MKITIYSTTTCLYCKMLKSFLDEKGVRYTEKLIDQDDEALVEMQGLAEGHQGTPFTIVEKDDGLKEKIIGFDKGKFEEILGE